MIYPLCFWLSGRDPLKNNFHHFHLGLPCFVGGVVVIFGWLGNLSVVSKWLLTFWIVSLIGVSWSAWKRDSVNVWFVTVTAFIGVLAYHTVVSQWGSAKWTAIFLGVLSGAVLSVAMYAMNLGHWYLNVHGLPLRHLRQAVYAFGALLLSRIFWDGAVLIFGKTLYEGEEIPLYRFLCTTDGFFISLGLFFGLLLPFVTLFFVLETIRLKNTQSATGILYVVLAAVFIGEVSFKYYLVHFGIAL